MIGPRDAAAVAASGPDRAQAVTVADNASTSSAYAVLLSMSVSELCVPGFVAGRIPRHFLDRTARA